MDYQVFWTVVSGTAVFVCGQFLLRSCIEPLIHFRKLMGDLSFFLLRNQSELLAGRARDDVVREIFVLGARLLEARQMVLFYKFFAIFGLLPKYSNVLPSVRSLYFIGNTLVKIPEGVYPSVDALAACQIDERVQLIKEKMGIVVDLSE